MLTDGRTTDAGVIGILIAHLGAFGSGELKIDTMKPADQNKYDASIAWIGWKSEVEMALQ